MAPVIDGQGSPRAADANERTLDRGMSMRRVDKRAEYTRPGVSEEEINEIRKCYWMLDTQDGKRPERGFIDPNDLMEAMNSLGIDWNKSELYQTLAEVDHDNSGNIGLEEFINLTTALITEADLDKKGDPSSFDRLFKKFDQGNDEYINLDKLRLVCRELGETLGSGSEQSDEQLKDMLRYAKNDDGGGSGGQLQVTKQELWDCLSKTRLMKS